MKRLVIFLFAIQIVSAGYLPAELIKMGNLYQHFQLHSMQGSEIGLMAFMRLHYMDPEHQASDPKNHDSLPMQGVHLMSVVFQHPVEEDMVHPLQESITVTRTLFDDPAFSKGNPAAIFQPPRVI